MLKSYFYLNIPANEAEAIDNAQNCALWKGGASQCSSRGKESGLQAIRIVTKFETLSFLFPPQAL